MGWSQHLLSFCSPLKGVMKWTFQPGRYMHGLLTSRKRTKPENLRRKSSQTMRFTRWFTTSTGVHDMLCTDLWEVGLRVASLVIWHTLDTSNVILQTANINRNLDQDATKIPACHQDWGFQRCIRVSYFNCTLNFLSPNCTRSCLHPTFMSKPFWMILVAGDKLIMAEQSQYTAKYRHK